MSASQAENGGSTPLTRSMLKESKYVKILVAVPVKDADKLRAVIGKAGAGVQGNYEYTSGSYRQIGRFKPMSGAKPAIGKTGQLEKVEEEAIETICHIDKVEQVIAEIKKAHPYEEPAIDIFPRLEIT